jgi:hypothetical protein
MSAMTDSRVGDDRQPGITAREIPLRGGIGGRDGTLDDNARWGDDHHACQA